MPKYLEDKLKAQYGEDSDIPYKIMNSMKKKKRKKRKSPKDAQMEALEG